MATYSSIKHNFTPPDATTSTQVGAGAMKLIKSVDASSDSTISFVDGTSDVVLDSTYKTYIFKFIHMHPATDDADFSFNGSTDSGSNYNVTKTTSFFTAYHKEDGSGDTLEYNAGGDLAQSTAFQKILSGGSGGTGNGGDECCSGELWLFNPSSTTFAKHFLSKGNDYQNGDYCMQNHVAGYFNTTSAIDAIQFKFDNGNTDAGTIKMYGIA